MRGNWKTAAILGVTTIFLAILALSTPGAAAATTCTFTTTGTTMTLDGDCTTDETIFIPDGYTLDGAGHTITAVDPSGDHFKGAVVQNAGSTAHVKNLTVTASSLANVCDGGTDRLRGIMFDGASGSITHNMVTDINQGSSSGCQEGNGIEVRNAPFDDTHPDTKHVTISNNIVTDYQKNGITANGDINASVTDNTVTGFGPVGFIAQNGIQMGFGATGRVMKNTVIGSWFTGADWVATGLLVFESNNVNVEHNAVSGNQVGAGVEAWCWFAPSANNNKVIKNTIEDAETGASVHSFTFLSNCNPAVNNNEVVNNTITNQNGGDTGVSIGAFDLDIPTPGFDPSADNNKVIHNTIKGYTTDIDDTGSTTKVHANVSEP